MPLIWLGGHCSHLRPPTPPVIKTSREVAEKWRNTSSCQAARVATPAASDVFGGTMEAREVQFSCKGGRREHVRLPLSTTPEVLGGVLAERDGGGASRVGRVSYVWRAESSA